MKKEILMPEWCFKSDKKLENLLKENNYDSIWEVRARLDKNIINYVKNNFKINDLGWYMDKDNNYVVVDEVDLSKKWIIEGDNSATFEYITYLKVVDEELNLYKHDYNLNK